MIDLNTTSLLIAMIKSIIVQELGSNSSKLFNSLQYAYKLVDISNNLTHNALNVSKIVNLIHKLDKNIKDSNLLKLEKFLNKSSHIAQSNIEMNTISETINILQLSQIFFIVIIFLVLIIRKFFLNK